MVRRDAITLGSVDVWHDDEPFPRPAAGSAVTIGAESRKSVG